MSLFTAPVFSARFKSGRTSGHIIIPERSTTKWARQGGTLPGTSHGLQGFPNLLIHKYTALDSDRVSKTLKDDMQVLEGFRRHVRDFIRENGCF